MSPVEKSASKWALMLALDLEEGNKDHQELYNAMKKEAVIVYDELLKGRRQRLKPECRHIPEPWSYSQFTETALRETIRTIEARAGPYTRPLYARGMVNGDNWVIRWFLYHICRYRDARNLRASRSSKFHEDDDVDGGGSSSSGSSKQASRLAKPGRNYDAARNSYK